MGGGRCLMIGLPGPRLTPDVAARVRRLGPAGLILFRRNLLDPKQTRGLIEDFLALVSRPTLVAIDQEGGRVSRLEPWLGPTPVATELAARGQDRVREFGAATARALRALGFNLDFAPVVDLSAPSACNGIGDRAFGTDPEGVSRHARGFLEGLQGDGVAGCLKHFPGLGPTTVDSHTTLPVVACDRHELEPHLRPYRELREVTAAVMVGHGHYPALDPEPSRPASCSPVIVRELLRGDIGFRGLVVTDDLEMGAVAPRDEDGRAAVEALAAGCDLLLYCADLTRAERAHAALEEQATRDAAHAARLEEAAGRIDRVAAAWPCAAGDSGAWDRALEAFTRFRERA